MLNSIQVAVKVNFLKHADSENTLIVAGGERALRKNHVLVFTAMGFAENLRRSGPRIISL